MEKKRILWIDLARFIAIFCVILCHVTENIFKLNIGFMSSINKASAAFAFFAFTFGRLGVPLFLMISGYLLLGRDYDSASTKKFYVNSVMRLVICTWIWFLIYDVFLVATGREALNIRNIVLDVLFLKSVGMSHVWYMPMIIGMYVLIPFVSNGVSRLDTSSFIFPLVFFGLLLFVYPLFTNINEALKLDIFTYPMLSNGFSGGVYGFYILLGYLVKKGILKKIRIAPVAVLAFLFYVAATLQMMFSYRLGHEWNMWYDCVFLMIASVLAFELLSRINICPMQKQLRFLSVNSFGVYLVHNMILVSVLPYFKSSGIILPLQVVLLELLLLILSYFASYLISRIPKIGKFLLYQK